jgi:hypothetical protein
MQHKVINSACLLGVQKPQQHKEIGVAAKNVKRCFLTAIQEKGAVRRVEVTWRIRRFLTFCRMTFQEHPRHKRIGDSATNAMLCFSTDIQIKGVVQQVKAMWHKDIISFFRTLVRRKSQALLLRISDASVSAAGVIIKSFASSQLSRS